MFECRASEKRERREKAGGGASGELLNYCYAGSKSDEG